MLYLLGRYRLNLRDMDLGLLLHRRWLHVSILTHTLVQITIISIPTGFSGTNIEISIISRTLLSISILIIISRPIPINSHIILTFIRNSYIKTFIST